MFVEQLMTRNVYKDKGKEIFKAEILPVKYGRKAIVTIISDDGNFSTGCKLNELAKKHGLRITVAGVVNWIKPYLKEWKKKEKEGYIELISHSYSHLKLSEEANIDSKEMEHQITDSIKYFKKNFKTDQIAFVPPENVICDEAYRIVKKNKIYAVRRGGPPVLNSLDPEEGTEKSQWLNLGCQGIGYLATTKDRNAIVNKAIESRTWLIEMWHNVTESGEEGGFHEISVDKADEHMDYIKQKVKKEEIWEASFVDVVKYIYERKNSVVEAWSDGKRITVKLNYSNSLLSPKVFNVPITIGIYISGRLEDPDAVIKKNKNINLRISENNQEQQLQFEMIPNSGIVHIVLN